ncbi:MAG TPA: hypothetical protein VHZ50_04490 [Puia sp.]|jgi:hypothetical protein|nr:hypothetical protein [Puia sp.]
MKTLFTLLLMTLIIIAGTVSFEFFTKSNYSTSAMFTLISIVAIDLFVYTISNKKVSL